ISTPAVADRQAAVRLIAADDSRVVGLVAVKNNAPVIERVDFVGGTASAPITLSHAMASTDRVVDLKADVTLARIAYIVRSAPRTFYLYFADVGAPVIGQQVGQIPSDADSPVPTIDAVRANGDFALLHTLELKAISPPAFYEDL